LGATARKLLETLALEATDSELEVMREVFSASRVAQSVAFGVFGDDRIDIPAALIAA
jgi:hypothetical protein